MSSIHEHPEAGDGAPPADQAAPVPAAPEAPATPVEATAAPVETADAAPAPVEPITFPPDPQTFADMQLRPDVEGALTEMGWLTPTEVQRSTFWKILAGRDLMVQARTGSGKTGAFAVPFAQKLVDASRGEVQVLALCPTRELALQVARECEKIGAGVGLKVAAVYGGAPMGKQIEARSDADGQFTLRVPGDPDEAVQLRLQVTPDADVHDHWVNLGQTHLGLFTSRCDK